MKEYAFTILMIAAMITLVAVAAGTIVYLRATRGAHSLTFQLSRIGIVWGTLIILLLLVGLFGFTVKEWTVASLGDVAGWFKERDLFHYALYWMQSNRLISSALLWGGVALLICGTRYLSVSTLSVNIIIAMLHVWVSYLIWQHPVWPFIKAVAFAIILICYEGDVGFQTLGDRTSNPAKIDAPPAGPTDSGSDDDGTAARRAPIEIIGDMVAECAETISHTTN